MPTVRRRRGRITPLILALLVFALLLAVTFGAWHAAEEERVNSTTVEFDFQVRQAVRRIEQRMATYEQVQRGAQAFLLGSMAVNSKDFRFYVESLRLAEKFPGIQGIALVAHFTPDQLAERNAAMGRSDPPFALRPAGVRAQYSGITHIEPFTRLNPRALGFDMLTEPVRREAMERSRDSGQAAASGKVRLIQENGRNEQTGLVMYLPFYARGAPVANALQRRAGLVGWVGAPFRMGDLMAGLGDERERDLLLSIYDGPSAAPEHLLFRSRAAEDARAHVP